MNAVPEPLSPPSRSSMPIAITEPLLISNAAIAPDPDSVPVLTAVSPDAGTPPALPEPLVSIQSVGLVTSLVPPIHAQVEADIALEVPVSL